MALAHAMVTKVTNVMIKVVNVNVKVIRVISAIRVVCAIEAICGTTISATNANTARCVLVRALPTSLLCMRNVRKMHRNRDQQRRHLLIKHFTRL